VASLQPLFESGKYFIHKSHEEAREELLTIGVSRWDDIVDTMAYGEQIITPGFFSPNKEPIKQSPWSQRPRLVNYGMET